MNFSEIFSPILQQLKNSKPGVSQIKKLNSQLCADLKKFGVFANDTEQLAAERRDDFGLALLLLAASEVIYKPLETVAFSFSQSEQHSLVDTWGRLLSLKLLAEELLLKSGLQDKRDASKLHTLSIEVRELFSTLFPKLVRAGVISPLSPKLITWLQESCGRDLLLKEKQAIVSFLNEVETLA